MALIRCPPIPLDGPLQIGLALNPALEDLPGGELRFRKPGRGRLQEPVDGAGLVPLYPLAAEQRQTEIVLAVRVAELCRLGPQEDRLIGIARHPAPLGVEARQVVERRRHAAFGRLLVPADRLFDIRREAGPADLVELAETVLRQGLAGLGGRGPDVIGSLRIARLEGRKPQTKRRRVLSTGILGSGSSLPTDQQRQQRNQHRREPRLPGLSLHVVPHRSPRRSRPFRPLFSLTR